MVVNDKNILSSLWQAIQVHEGKAVPELVPLPFDHNIQQYKIMNEEAK